MAFKVFVSGKYGDRKLIKTKMDELKKLGFEIIHDWTTYEDEVGDKKKAGSAAIFDIDGVKNCDMHIVVISDDKYPFRGTFCEMGCSLGLNKKILILNPFNKANCMTVPFYFHPLVTHFKTWDELVSFLEKIRDDKEKCFEKIIL